MLQPSSTPENPAGRRNPPAYGELMQYVLFQVQEAVALSARTREPQVAHDELLGYERFLHTAGEHLVLLTHLGHERPEGVRQLSVRLATVPRPEANASAWSRAAVTLGAAHDLVATHVDARFLAISPEAEDITAGDGTGLAVRQLTGLLLKGAHATQQLMRTASNTQRRRHDLVIPGPLFREVAAANHRILLNAKAALWDFDNELPTPPSSSLSHVQTPALSGGSSPSFDSALQALRALRQLSYDQVRGRTAASAASLHDLAALAARITDPTYQWSTAEPTSGLDRLRAAHSVDQLTTAHHAWHLAGHDLAGVVQGTTKAPRVYQSAMARLNEDLPDLTPPVRLAILSALPRLGHEAGNTIRRLDGSNALVHRRRDPSRLSASWQPLQPADSHELTQRFDAAADATAPAAATLRQLLTTAAPPGAPDTPPGAPVPARHHETLTRGLSR